METAIDLAITAHGVQQFSALVYRESEILLPSHQKDLLVNRLMCRLRDLNLQSFQAYDDLEGEKPGGSEVTALLDLMSTNKTDCFREPAYCQVLRARVLPELADHKVLRIWSSAR
ncbi:MAG: hypothetical protein ACOYXR_00965 [Nitrospirota bacterium]